VSPSNAMSPRLRPTSVQSGILIHTAALQAFGRNRHGSKIGTAALPQYRLGRGLPPYQVVGWIKMPLGTEVGLRRAYQVAS